MSKIFEEGAKRPNYKKRHNSASNSQLWEIIEQNSGTNRLDFDGDNDAQWFAVDKQTAMFKDNHLADKAEYYFETSSEVSSLNDLADKHKRFREYIAAYEEAEDREALKQFMELIKEEEDYSTLMDISKNFTIEWRATKRSSGKCLGIEIINKGTKDEMAYYKYAVESDKLTYSMASAIRENAKGASKYFKEIQKAEVARREAAIAEQERIKAEKAKDEQIAEMQKQMAEMMAKLKEAGLME